MRFKPILLIILLASISRAENTCMAGMIKCFEGAIKCFERAIDSTVNAMDNCVERSKILENIIDSVESFDVKAIFYNALLKLT